MPPALTAFSLWDHQKVAVTRLRDYVRAFEQGKTKRAALVHIPTGAGKSGIIALTTRLTPKVGNSLVLAPRIALRDQLGQDITRRFFEKLDKHPDLSKIPKSVQVWKTQPLKTTVTSLADTVVVATIQSFHSWSSDAANSAYDLKDRVDLLAIDEGHYEPAPVWRQALRAVAKPTILFTATPYRNDLKSFDIDYDFAVGFTHSEALDEHILRKLEVRDRPTPASPEAFVNDVLAEYDALFGVMDQDDLDAPRVIIRCEAADRIRQIGTALAKRGVEYVAVHELFTDGRPNEYQHVPDPHSTKPLVWVHQFKMIEGIDDSRFRLVALYDPLRNTRMLIQQVGRVLRNPGRANNQSAYLLDHHRGMHGREWARYLDYDEAVKAHGLKSLLEPTQKMLQGVLAALPKVAYLDRTFRVPLDLSALDPKEDLRLPKSATVYRYDKARSLAEMQSGIQSHCDERDLPVQIFPLGADTLVAVYFVQRNSPFLDNAFFLDNWLGVSVVHIRGDWLFIYDSDGGIPDDLPGLGAPVPSAKLKRVFQDSKQTRLTHVSVRSSNLAPTAVRTRAITAASVRDTLPSAEDVGSVCSTVEGYTPGGGAGAASKVGVVRRYVGFRNGRVSDYDGGGCRLDEYLDWTETISQQLTSTSKGLPEFKRYAQETQVPTDPTPTHVLLDAADLTARYVTIPEDGEPEEQLLLDDRAFAVTKTAKGHGKFTLKANGTDYEISVRYDDSRRRYVLASPDFEAAYKSTDPFHTEGIIRAINQLQGFRLLTETRGFFYTHGQFYHPEVEFGPNYDDEQIGIFRVLTAVAELKAVSSEKGNAKLPPHDRWPNDSLFGIVYDLGGKTALAAAIGKPTHLVCDDLNDEAADFIVADAVDRRVAFVHAKASADWHPCSASQLEVVCSQAMKNVRYLAKFSAKDAPNNVAKWGTKDWKLEKRSLNRVLRAPNKLTGSALWDDIHRIIRDPHATCEVWLLLGSILSVSEFRKKLIAAKPEPEAIQAAYLLFSTMTTAYSVGARLRVFCSP